MTRVRICCLLLLLCLLWGAASAETGWVNPPLRLRLGDVRRFEFNAEGGTARISLLDPAGREVSVIRGAMPTAAGSNTFFFDGSAGADFLPEGDYLLRLSADGETADWRISLRKNVPEGPQEALDTAWHTPGEGIAPLCAHENCYWAMNMGEQDEAAVWAMLTAPITVLKGSQREQKKVRAEPSAKCTSYTGEVTFASQGVHVLETSPDGDWTRIGAYSSSVEGSRIRVFAKYFEGWVESSLLETKPVSQKYGIVIDKLKQRLYVYKEGRLFSTLLCSTGFAKRSTPFNETPAGEFLAISWSGGFWSNNLWCDYGIRINDGILLHEVPVIVTQDALGNEIRDLDRCQNFLGDRASHGCIRIQRLPTPEGVTMKWLWDNLERKNTKVIIWDDLNRQLSAPDPDLPLYYNPDSGKNYHSSPVCAGVSERFLPLKEFAYKDLGKGVYKKLTPCPYCAPASSPAVVDKLNKDARK